MEHLIKTNEVQQHQERLKQKKIRDRLEQKRIEKEKLREELGTLTLHKFTKNNLNKKVLITFLQVTKKKSLLETLLKIF